MQVTEIYRSIQGESSFAGLPCTFVRLTGCNLRCNWCDSGYTFTGGKRMTIDEVEGDVKALAHTGLVEITGGEPMLQEREVVVLMESLIGCGYTVLLETSGERPLKRVPHGVHKIVDVKCPGSGESSTFDEANLALLGRDDEVKFVLASREDYVFAREFVQQHGLIRSVGGVIFSPAFRKDASGERDVSHCLLDPRELADWIVADGLNLRLGLQIHKFIWAPEIKGV